MGGGDFSHPQMTYRSVLVKVEIQGFGLMHGLIFMSDRIFLV